MHYNTDQAITKSEDDLLGRKLFSQQLGKSIFEYKGTDSLVIGLFGEWGTGKTSIANMVLQEIESLPSNADDSQVIVRFSPWNYSDKDSLICRFFYTLKSRLEKSKNTDWQKIGRLFARYSDALDVFKFIPWVNSEIIDLLKNFVRVSGNNFANTVDLDNSRLELENVLKQAENKIVVLIDDIDRLTNQQIRDVFQLVKQVGNLPNIVYILAMDRVVVGRALTDIHNCDGSEYLEKIIQISIEIPTLRKSSLYNLFGQKLLSILRQDGHNVMLDQDYWEIVFGNCIAPYLNTMRDVNRILNTFMFRFGILHQETSAEDMLAITAIEVLEPELYKWIANNKDVVCGGLNHSFYLESNKETNHRKRYLDYFINHNIDAEKAIKCVATLFPRFANEVKEYIYHSSTNNDMVGKMRIAHSNRFDLYFSMDLSDIRVPRNEMLSMAYEQDEKSLQKSVEQIENAGNTEFFLDEMHALINTIPYERLNILGTALIHNHGLFSYNFTGGLYMRSASGMAEACIVDIIGRLGSTDERYNFLRNNLAIIDMRDMHLLASIIRKVEDAYGRLGSDSKYSDGQLISLEQLMKIEQLYVKKIGEVARDISFLDIWRFNLVLYLWKCFDKTGAEKFISANLKNDNWKLKFICGTASMWNGTDGRGWDFNLKMYEHYIASEDIFNIIKRSIRIIVQDFTQAQQIKLASFVLKYQQNGDSNITEDEALQLVEDWKSSGGNFMERC